jgi:hypothetical protein
MLPNQQTLEAVLPLLRSRWQVPRSALCETHRGNGVSLAILTHPISRHGESELHAMVAVRSARNGDLNSYLQGLESLIGASRMEIPGVRTQPIPQGCLLAVPWVFRGEIRAAALAALLPAGEAVKRFVGTGPDSWLPGDGGSRPQDLEGLRRSLYRFVYPSPLDRWLLVLSRRKAFRLPGGCNIRESTRVNVKDWRVTFTDIDNLERAHMLYAAYLNRRPLRHLIAVDPITDPNGDDSVLAELKFVAIQDYQKARRELAMVIWHNCQPNPPLLIRHVCPSA